MKDSGGPYLAMALLCEQILEEKDGVVSIIRAIDRWTITASGPDAPESIPPGQTIDFVLVVQLIAGKARGRVTLMLDLEKPSGEFGKRVEMPVFFEGEDRGARVAARIKLPVEQEGLYWFHILLDKTQLLTKVPLRIVYRPFRGPGQPIS